MAADFKLLNNKMLSVSEALGKHQLLFGCGFIKSQNTNEITTANVTVNTLLFTF